jgi:PEGA domain
MARSSQTLIAVMVALGLGMPALAGAQGRTAPAGSTTVGTAVDRPSGGASSGGSTGSGGGSSSPGSIGSSGGGSSGNGGAVGRGPNGQPVTNRDRNGRPIVGTAMAGLATVTGLPGPTFGQFDPYFGSAGLLWDPWYDSLFYDPFDPFGYGYNAFRYGGSYNPTMGRGGAGGTESVSHLTGSLRIKASPETATVYVDGVRAGAAKEFDGLLSHHLVLEAGPHQLELRADGYETYHETITVDVGKTLTERLSLKKTK